MPRFFEGKLLAPAGKFALCVARFNGFITEELLKGALDALVRHGVSDDEIDVYRVPGTFELSGLVRKVAESGHYVGVVALGCVIRGGTPHFEYVSSEVSKGVGTTAYNADCAVSFGVLTTDSVEQAIDRAGVKAGNKGAEAAIACLEMANLHAELDRSALKASGLKNKGQLASIDGRKKK
ncbi:MAG: 6,7-dimethyl-8-ribityllumazine synthase [Myxococcaceae bacterium]